jgi:Flp pilus assembly pilin Flp
MEYVAIAYGLIALVLIGYTVHLHQRLRAAQRERAALQARQE